MGRLERWSVRTLRAKIQSMLYERTALSRKPADFSIGYIDRAVSDQPARDSGSPASSNRLRQPDAHEETRKGLGQVFPVRGTEAKPVMATIME